MKDLPWKLVLFLAFTLPHDLYPQPRLTWETGPAKSGPRQEVELRLVDSATGYSIEPDAVVVRSDGFQGGPARTEPLAVRTGGRFALSLAAGDYALELRARGYRDMALGLTVEGGSQPPVSVFLVPLEGPRELESSFVRSRHRPGATLVTGFVVDDETGAPLEGVDVGAQPGGVHARTDERGFYSLYAPLTDPDSAGNALADLSFEAPGYRGEERRNVELWSNGDWIYRIRLRRGEGTVLRDEARNRLRTVHEGEEEDVPRQTAPPLSSPNPVVDLGDAVSAVAAAAVSIPRTIRVSYSTGVHYRLLEDYCKLVLPAEWIPSWGALAGGLGMNSLRAGAVAIRTYGIGYVKNPQSASYDICSTTSCQVYDPSLASSYTNDAVDQTSGVVMLNSGGAITFKMTEYSSENNALGFSCGDGYSGNSPTCIYDPVCATTDRNGHGRGMCQRGSARWASGLYLSTLQQHPYGTKTWQGILNHYYPGFQISQGQPLSPGDAVKVVGTGGIGLKVRECSGGGIASGVNCPQKGSRSDGQTGVILSGPQWITTDGGGYTWWRISWDSDGMVGWSVENWLERTTPSTGTIQVAALRDGSPWSGSVSYQLSGPSGSSGSSVPSTFSSKPPGSYTLSYTSGGPSGTSFTGITPAASQTLASGGTITFTLNFTTSASQPTVTTQPASSVGPSGATLSASVDPHGASTTVYFDYGTTTGYGSTATYGSIGTSSQTVSVQLSGLQCNTLYHFRGRATNSAGTGNGTDRTFTTSSCSGPPPPVVTTNAASGIGQGTATLNGSANPNGSATTAYFEWGATTGYGNSTPSQGLGGGTSAVPYSQPVSGLSCGTQYHFRAVAGNSGGSAAGLDQTFTTASCPPSGGGQLFYTVAPCRIVDTRDWVPLESESQFGLQIAGSCGIPFSAVAVAANVTVISPTGFGHLTVWPWDLAKPEASTINFIPGKTRANNAIVRLATDGFGDVRVEPFVTGDGTVHFLLDVTGYFE